MAAADGAGKDTEESAGFAGLASGLSLIFGFHAQCLAPMTEQCLRIALGSTFCRIGDIDYNLAQIADFAEQARRSEAHILLTPEMSVTGYGSYPEVVLLAECAGEGPVYGGLAAITRKTGVTIAAGFVERLGHGPGISHYVVFPGGEFVVQRKFRVTPYESPLVSALARHPHGEAVPEKLDFNVLHFPTFEIEGVRSAVVICADSGIAGLQDYFDTLGVRAVFAPVGAGGDVKERVRSADLCTEEGRERYQRALEKAWFPGAGGVFECIMHRRAVAAVNQTGWDGRSYAHIGDGSVISPRGEMPVVLSGVPNLDFQRPAFRVGSIPLAHFEA